MVIIENHNHIVDIPTKHDRYLAIDLLTVCVLLFDMSLGRISCLADSMNSPHLT